MSKNKLSKEMRKKLSAAEKKRCEIKQTLIDNKIYLISIDDIGTPFLADLNYFLIYFNKEDAEVCALDYSKMYPKGSIQVFEIKGNLQFFEMMWHYGLHEFIINGDSEVYNIGTFFVLPRTLNNTSDGVLAVKKQPRRKRLQLQKKIVVKKGFSYFSNISIACAIVFFAMVILFGVILKIDKEHDYITRLAVLLPGIGFISGITSVIISGKDSNELEGKALVGIGLSILELILSLATI